MKIKYIKLLIIGLILIPMFLFSASIVNNTNVSAADPATGLQKGADKATENTGTPKELFKGNDSVLKNIANTLLYIIGAVSVLMLIYGGIRYTISGGDEKAITAAKNTILYSVIGLVVAIAAYAIVNWVIGVFSVASTTSATMAQTHQTPQQAIDQINSEFKFVTKGSSVAEYAINNYIKPTAIMAQKHHTVEQATVAINNEVKSATKGSSVAEYVLNQYIKPIFVPAKPGVTTTTGTYTNIEITAEPGTTTPTEPDTTVTTTEPYVPTTTEPDTTVTTEPDITNITEPDTTTEIITDPDAPTESATSISEIESSDSTDGDSLTSEEITAIDNEVATAKAASDVEAGKTTLTAQQIRNKKMVANAEYETGKGYGEFSALGDNVGIWHSSTDNNRLGEYQHYTGCPNVAWCASFVAFIHHKTTATPGKAKTTGRSLRACGVSAMQAKAGDKLKNYNSDGNPHPGDILGWHTNDLSRGHTGILIKILNNGKYYTVEGNGGSYPSKVRYFTRAASYWRSQANAHYIRP